MYFLVEHGTTILVSTTVFAVLSLLTRFFTSENDSPTKKGEVSVLLQRGAPGLASRNAANSVLFLA